MTTLTLWPIWPPVALASCTDSTSGGTNAPAVAASIERRSRLRCLMCVASWHRYYFHVSNGNFPCVPIGSVEGERLSNCGSWGQRSIKAHRTGCVKQNIFILQCSVIIVHYGSGASVWPAIHQLVPSSAAMLATALPHSGAAPVSLQGAVGTRWEQFPILLFTTNAGPLSDSYRNNCHWVCVSSATSVWASL